MPPSSPLASRCPGAGRLFAGEGVGAAAPPPEMSTDAPLGKDAAIGDATELARSSASPPASLTRAKPRECFTASSLLRRDVWFAWRISASRRLILVQAARPRERICMRSCSWNSGQSSCGNFAFISTNSSNVMTPLESVSKLRGTAANEGRGRGRSSFAAAHFPAS